jgi:hypothetical protein
MPMRIKLLTSRVGEFGVQCWGEIIELADDEAARMIASGQAELVYEIIETPESKTESAQSIETTVQFSKQKKQRNKK